jgi:predicted RND superfamily exporter protein
MKKLIEFSINSPKYIYAIVILLVALAVSQFPRIQIDTDPENMLPAANAARQFHNEIKEKFQLHDAIVVGAINEAGIYTPASLANIHQLTKQILTIDGVIAPDLMSLSEVDNISQDGSSQEDGSQQPGSIRFEWMMRDAPTTQQQADQVQANVTRLPLLFDTLVSQDNKAAAIYVPIANKDESYRIAEQIRGFIAQLDSQDEFHITGLPVAEDQFGYEMFIQMGIAAPLAGLMIFIVMWLFFRNVALITAPMLMAMAVVLVTMGLLIGMGFTVHIMSSMIAIFLMPIAVVDSVHIMSEFADTYRPGQDAKVVIKKVVSHLFKPMLFTTLTSSVGFIALMLTPIPPVQVFGAFIGFGIVLAFILTMTFIPAYVSRMSEKQLTALQAVQHQADSSPRIERVLNAIGKIATGNSRILILLFMSLFAVSVVGLTKIQINDNPVNWFKADHEIRVADVALNKHFAGTYDAYLVLDDNNIPDFSALDQSINPIIAAAQSEGIDITTLWVNDMHYDLEERIALLDDALFDLPDEAIPYVEQIIDLLETENSQSKAFLKPANLHYIEQLQTYLATTDLVGKSNSIADVVKTVNRELRSGDATDYVLTDSSNATAQVLLQYQSSHRPQDLWHFVSKDYRSSVIWLQLSSGDNQDMSAVITAIDSYISANPLPQDISLNYAGKAYINVVWQDAMVAGMLKSLISAFFTVFIMMIVLFRSIPWGVLAMLPLTFTVTLMYGLIGWVGKDYDMPIAVLSALTLGLSVDFAIHFIDRTRDIYKQTGSFEQTMRAMFAEPGRAIGRNATVIAIGFTPLLAAPLVPYITVGVFLASIMAISALVTLVLLPAVMQVAQPLLFKPSVELASRGN